MNHLAPLTNTLHFDTELCTIINTRRLVVHAHLARWQEQAESLCINDTTAASDWVIALEKAVCRVSAEDFAVRSRGRERWLNVFLLPLAEALNVREVAESTTLRQLYRTGAFDHDNPTEGIRQRPPDDVLAAVRDLLVTVPFHKRRIAALCEQGLCRDKDAAIQVVDAWRRCEQRAAGLARGVVLTYLTYGDLGLLTNSTYPFTDELLYLESQRSLIAEITDPALVAQVQVDLVALMRAWQATFPKLWSIRLLREPRDSEYRRHLCRAVGTRRQANIAHVLETQFGYTPPEALDIVSQTLIGGLRALAAFRARRSGIERTADDFERHQLQRVLRHQYAMLLDDDLRYIETLLLNLHAAVRVSGAPLPLRALLVERPSSRRRVQVSRRFRFGLAAIIKRRQQRRTGRKRTLQQRVNGQSPRRAPPQPKTAPQLIRTFAELSHPDERDAEYRIRNFITYGAIGLLPRGDWERCLDPRLYSWLRLIKYGRLDGRVPWQQVMAQLDTYRQSLGLATPVSSILARAVFNAIQRPSFWHGGQGEATIRLRQRGTLTLGKAPRLHETWVVGSVPLTVPLADALGQPTGNTSHLVVVIEAAGNLPLAVWPCAEPATIRDVCLALYQAIWHPGATNWPVKGIPEQIVVSTDLMQGDRMDLDRAIAYLLSEVKTQAQSTLATGQLNSVFKPIAKSANQIMTQLSLNERIVSRVMREVEAWITDEFYADHSSAPVWPEIAQHGVVMPGHDTPAAGWLLPVLGEATVSTDGITYEGRSYRTPLDATLLVGGVHIRHFPTLIAGGEGRWIVNGVFVQARDNGAGPVLRYANER
jgi:hypothetical protein